MKSIEKIDMGKKEKERTIDWIDLCNKIKNPKNSKEREEAEGKIYQYMLDNLKGRLIKNVTEDEAQDVLHEIFIYLIGKIREGEIKNLNATQSYMNRVLQGKMIQTINNRQIDRNIFPETTERYETRESNYKTSQDEAHRKLDLEEFFKNKELVQKLLSDTNLKSEERIIIESFYLKEKSKEEILEEMKLTEDQFRNIKHRALEKIRAKLKRFI